MCKQMNRVALLGMFLMSTAFAQPATYPTKPIRWLIPFAAGGGTDVIARPLVQKLSERLGQSIIYENRGGAGGVVAGEIVARANPDGYTLLVAAVAVMTVTVSLVDKMPFDPVKDFAPITKFANVPNILVARPGFAPRTLQEIVDYAHANPGKLIWASSGTGSAGMLTMELFRLNNKLQMVHVPYKGAGPATTGVLTNEADLLFANPGVFMGHIKAGRLRPIVACSTARLPVLPDLPTVGEMGFRGYENGSWYGLAAPARTPAPIIKRLHDDMVDVLKDPDIVASFARDGAAAVGNTPEAFAQEIRDDIVKWAKIIKAANVKI
jgi:tripartite-type tricarboxylate transporter receptor subunit TctC